MPLVHRTNNRILPANARSADVARQAVDDLKIVERRRYHAAFTVQGNQGVLYHALTCGLRCHCKSRSQSLNARLGADGKADIGMLNSMLTGGLEFGILPYGMAPARNPIYDPEGLWSAELTKPLAPDPAPGNDIFVIDQSSVTPRTPNATNYAKPNLPGLYDSDGIDELQPAVGTAFDSYTKDELKQPGSTIVGSGVGPNGPISDDVVFEELINTDVGLGGVTDANCPICMGTGYVGGYSVLNGWRKVLTFQVPGSAFRSPGTVNVETVVAEVECTTAEFPLVLPSHAIGVDALRVWNTFQVLSPAIYVDGIQLTTQQDLMRFCDGRGHVLKLIFPQPTFFTHVEVQVNQSRDTYLFDLPKTTKGNTRTQLQNMQDMTILMSPKVPMVRPGDYVAESTYGNVLAISSVPAWNDNKLTVLGWECEVRAVQPRELHFLLPRRRQLATPNSPPLVRDNGSGHRRT